MCTAATYKTKDFYFGRTLDYEFSYGDQITITPRNYPFSFRHIRHKDAVCCGRGSPPRNQSGIALRAEI